MDNLIFYTVDEKYVFLNEDLKAVETNWNLAGEFVVDLANFDVEFFKMILSYCSIALYRDKLNIIRKSMDIPQDIIPLLDVENLEELIRELKETRTRQALNSLQKHFLFRTLPINEIIDFLQNDFFNICSKYIFPITAKAIIVECINELEVFQNNTPEIGVMELTELCERIIYHYVDMTKEIINNNFEIVNNLKQSILVKMVYLKEEGQAVCLYCPKDLESLLAFDTVFLQAQKVSIKQCANCHNYFIPYSRSDQIYCDSIFENGKTCKQIGYENKLKKDAFKSAYRKAYKTQRARIKYNAHIVNYEELHFIPWQKAAKEAMQKFQSANDIYGFQKWLEENRDKYK